MFKVPNQYRIRSGPLGSSDDIGNKGAFRVGKVHVIASDELGWEHVSVSTPKKTPTWAQMSQVKSLFWDDEDLVVQIHPPKNDHINVHNFCLHMWRKSMSNDFCELPPKIMV